LHFNSGFKRFEVAAPHHAADEEPGRGRDVGHGVAAQVETESKTRKQFIMVSFQALSSSVSSVQPAPPYHGEAEG
jgi:hypothetical protein